MYTCYAYGCKAVRGTIVSVYIYKGYERFIVRSCESCMLIEHVLLSLTVSLLTLRDVILALQPEPYTAPHESHDHAHD